MNYETGNVIYVGKGKGADALDPFWALIGPRRAKKIKAVAIDMSPAYISAISTHLPHAVIIYDHFHIIKLLNKYLDELRRSVYRESSTEQRKLLKGIRWILLKRGANLNDDKNERTKLEEALALNESLSFGYYLKEDISQVWEQDSKED